MIDATVAGDGGRQRAVPLLLAVRPPDAGRPAGRAAGEPAAAAAAQGAGGPPAVPGAQPRRRRAPAYLIGRGARRRSTYATTGAAAGVGSDRASIDRPVGPFVVRRTALVSARARTGDQRVAEPPRRLTMVVNDGCTRWRLNSRGSFRNRCRAVGY